MSRWDLMVICNDRDDYNALNAVSEILAERSQRIAELEERVTALESRIEELETELRAALEGVE
jgi:polyhydroxyalkanoate synthesis regulator phasin